MFVNYALVLVSIWSLLGERSCNDAITKVVTGAHEPMSIRAMNAKAWRRGACRLYRRLYYFDVHRPYHVITLTRDVTVWPYDLETSVSYVVA